MVSRPDAITHKIPMPDREFGVPFPGPVLPADKWTQTALKAMPDGVLDWPALFGRTK